MQQTLDQNRECMNLLQRQISNKEKVGLFLQALEDSNLELTVKELHTPGEQDVSDLTF